MANGKYPWILGTLVVVYAGWVALSGFLAHATNLPWVVRDQKVAILDHPRTVNGLIVGGSNAMFSLSAKEMSALTGDEWFNASLMNEGFSFENQTEFLTQVAETVDPVEVRTVVVSSIRHIQDGRSEKLFETNVGFDGLAIPPVWLPYRSILDLVVEPPLKIYPNIVTPDGDFIHEGAVECVPAKRSQPVVWATDKAIDDMLDTWVPTLNRLFPRAEIVITLPAQFLFDPIPETEVAGYVTRLTARIDEWRAANPAAAPEGLSVLVEDNLTDKSLVCNASHHLNAAGREVRTRALVDALEARTTDNR